MKLNNSDSPIFINEIDCQITKPLRSLNNKEINLMDEELFGSILETLSVDFQKRLRLICNQKTSREQLAIFEALEPLSSFDRELLLFIFEIQYYSKENRQNIPKETALQRLALTKLIQHIDKSKKLFVEGRYSYPPEVYNRALQNTWMFVARNIHRYDYTKAKVITWINFKLGKEFSGAVQDHIQRLNREREIQEKLEIKKQRGGYKDSKQDEILENYQLLSLSEKVYKYLEKDRTGIFVNTYIDGHPEANLQNILLRLCKQGETMRNIAGSFNMNEQRVTSFKNRSLEVFALFINVGIKDCHEIYNYIAQDTGGRFQDTCMKINNKIRSEANFKQLMLRLLKENTLVSIASDWQVSVPEIHAFLEKNLKLKKFGEELKPYYLNKILIKGD